MNIGTLTIEMAANVARLSKDMDTARRTVDRAMGDIGKSISRLTGMIGGMLAGFTVGAFTSKLVSVQREFDILYSSLQTAAGGAQKADVAFAWIKDFAATTPYGLAEVTQAFIKMKNLGLDASRGALESYGNTASAMGKSLNQMIEAVADAATGEFERLKEFGIKANKEGEKVTFTFRGVKQTIQNDADAISGYLRKLGEVEFGGAMELRAKTLDGAISNLGDTWDELFRTVNDRATGSIIYDAVKLASGAIEDITEIFKAMTTEVDKNSEATGAMATIQEGLGTVFETVAVVGTNVWYVLKTVGRELGGIAAQVVAFLSGDFAGAGVIREEMVRDAELARLEVEKTSARIMEARGRTVKALGDIGNAGEETGKKVVKGLGDGGKEAKKFQEQLEKLLDKINAKDTGLDNDFYDNMLMLRKGMEQGKIVFADYLAIAEKYIKQQKFYTDAEKEREKAIEDTNKARQKELEDQEKLLASTEDMVEQMEFELSIIRLSNTEKEIAIKLRELEKKGLDETSESYKHYAERIRNAIIGKDAVEAALEQQRKTQEDWAKTWDQVAESFTDALMSGGQSVKQLLINLFKTMVLRPLLQPVMGAVSGMIQGLFGGGGGAAGGGGGGIGGILNFGSGINSLFNMGSTAAGWIGSGVGALFGQTAGNAAIASSLGFGTGSATAAATGASIAGGGTGAFAGIGSMIGTALPWIGAALAVISMFSDDDSGTFHTGSLAQYSAEGGLETSTTHGDFDMGFGGVEYSESIENIVSTLAKSISMGLDATAKSFGRTAGFEVATAFADDTSEDGAWGSLRISQNGKDLLNWDDDRQSKWAPREFADGEEGYKQYLALVAKDTRRVMMDEMDLPSWADDMLEGLGKSPTMEQLLAVIENINKVQAAFDQFKGVLGGWANMTDEAFAGLMKLSGGIDALTANLNTFYAEFYTDVERAAHVQQQIDDALKEVGLTTPKTREEYRRLAEQQDLNTESGREAYAVLMRLAGAFASIHQEADDAAEAVDAAQARIDAATSMFSMLERAIDLRMRDLEAQRAETQSRIDDLRGVLAVINDSVRDIYSTMSATAQMQAMDGMAFIQEALRTGSVSNAGDLSNAIGAARAQIDGKQYSSSADRDFDRLVLASQLRTLGQMTEEQLTTEELTLRNLDSMMEQLERSLEFYQKQLDALNGIDTSVLSVEEAISRLEKILGGEGNTGIAGDKPGSGGIGGITWGSSSGEDAKYKRPISLATAGVGYVPVIDEAEIARLDELAAIYHQYDGTGDGAGLMAAMSAMGATAQEMSGLSGLFANDWIKFGDIYGYSIPAFERGTDEVPGDMLALLHKGERVQPKRYNPALDSDISDETLEVLQAMRVDLTAMRTQLDGTNERLDRVASATNGNPEAPVPVRQG